MEAKQTFFEWEKQFVLGIPLIDRQHEKLIQLTKNLHFTYLQSTETASHHFIDAAHEVVDLLRQHFSNEEKLMLLFDFPEYAEHKKEHENFVMEILNQARRFSLSSYLTPYRFIRSIKEWASSHIEVFDKKAADFVLSMKNHDDVEQFFPDPA